MDEVEKKRTQPAHDPFAPPPEDLADIPLATGEPHGKSADAHGAMFDPPAEDMAELTLEDEKPRTQLGPDAFAPPPDKFAPPDEAKAGADLKLEEYDKKARPRNPLVERMEQERAPRAGCQCRKHYDVYLDNDFGGMAAWIGGGFGLLLLTLAFWMGPFGALSVALFGATCGGAATSISISLRCEGCRKTVTDLTEEEYDWLRRGRMQVMKYTAMLGVFTVLAISSWLWFI
ncbi:MAG TPA: hypothetical protein VGM90_31945 [Kofleriaceae bacterium]